MKKNHCIVHGEMNVDNAYECKNTNGSIRLRCKECAKVRKITDERRRLNVARVSEWKKNNRERVNEWARKDRLENHEKYKQLDKEYYQRNRDKENIRVICHSRDITKEKYWELLTAQKELCAICNLPESRKASRNNDNVRTRLCLDHDHETNQIRGFLCHDCNTGLGKFKDSPELLLMAVDYLVKHKGWTTNAST
jgi:hypothetical protein